MNVADIRGLFPGLKDTIYLNTATMAVGCTPARAAYEAAGAVPLDVVRDGVDFLAAASHKFLLGSRGMGYLFVRRGLLDRIRPILPGWKAARKPLESFYGPAMDLSPTASQLDTSLVWFAALAEQAAFGIFRQFGIQALLDRNAQLSQHLHDQWTTPKQP